MGDNNGSSKRKGLEMEFDLFEREISGLVPRSLKPPHPQVTFVPAQIRKMSKPVAPNSTLTAFSPHSNVFTSHRQQLKSSHPHPHHLFQPSPIIISGAPQVYNTTGQVSNARPQTKTTGRETDSNKTMSATSQSTSRITPVSHGTQNQSLMMSNISGSTASLTQTCLYQGSSSVLPDVPSAYQPCTETQDVPAEKKKKKKKKKNDKKPKKVIRSAGGEVWEDATLAEWDSDDYRLFCGDLGIDVTDEVLIRIFSRYPSFKKAKVVRERRTNKSKGFGFVSFKDPNDYVRAVKELDGTFVGSRPIKLRKSNWKTRNLSEVRQREKERTSLVNAIVKK